MNYEEFVNYKEATDNKFVKKFVLDNGNTFYLEPAFYTQMLGLFERYPNEKEKFMSKLDELIRNNKLIAFVYDFENPFLDYGDAVLREFVDVTDACKIFYEDKSRGSDYGD
jgi:hypothetical protein